MSTKNTLLWNSRSSLIDLPNQEASVTSGSDFPTKLTEPTAVQGGGYITDTIGVITDPGTPSEYC